MSAYSQKRTFGHLLSSIDSLHHDRYALSPGKDGVKRRLAAILAADVVGYTRLMGVDETGTLTSLKRVHSSTSPIAGLSGETGATPERDIPRRELNRLKPESQRRTVAMRVLMARWVLPMSCAIVLVTVTACDVGIEPRQETDAELYCRQGGFGLGSTAYADCVASQSGIQRRVRKR